MSKLVFNEIQNLVEHEGSIIERKKAILRMAGWSSTCNTPGVFWVWVKDFPKHYGTIMASTDLAFSIERAWQSYQPENWRQET